MLFFGSNKLSLTRDKVYDFAQQLESAYVGKEPASLVGMFHRDLQDIPFLDPHLLAILSQKFHLQTEILDFKILKLEEKEATFTYARKHLYEYVHKEDDDGDSLNNISSYFVEIQVKRNKILITDHEVYSEIFLDRNGVPLPGEEAVVPSSAQFFHHIEPYLQHFQLDDFLPKTYTLGGNAEFIWYSHKKEHFAYRPAVHVRFDYFVEETAETIAEHTEGYLNSNAFLQANRIKEAENYSIVETKLTLDGQLNHEIVLSASVENGMIMIRYQRDAKDQIDPDVRQDWIEQMLAAAKLEAAGHTGEK